MTALHLVLVLTLQADVSWIKSAKEYVGLYNSIADFS
jgi:glycogen synthase